MVCSSFSDDLRFFEILGVCDPLLWWTYVSSLNFNAYHLSRIGYRSDWKDLSISTLEFPKTRFYHGLSLYEIVTPNAESGSQGSWFLFQAGWYVDKPIYGLHLSCPRTIRSWTVRRNYAAHHLTFEGSVDVRSISSCLKMHFSITWRVAFMANDGVKRN